MNTRATRQGLIRATGYLRSFSHIIGTHARPWPVAVTSVTRFLKQWDSDYLSLVHRPHPARVSLPVRNTESDPCWSWFWVWDEASGHHAWTINKPHLPYKAGLDVMRSHPLPRMHFGQYQATSAVLGWPGDGDCINLFYLLHTQHKEKCNVKCMYRTINVYGSHW